MLNTWRQIAVVSLWDLGKKGNDRNHVQRVY